MFLMIDRLWSGSFPHRLRDGEPTAEIWQDIMSTENIWNQRSLSPHEAQQIEFFAMAHVNNTYPELSFTPKK